LATKLAVDGHLLDGAAGGDVRRQHPIRVRRDDLQLAVATLAQCAKEERTAKPGRPSRGSDLADGRPAGLRVTNTGTGTVTAPFRVRRSRGSPARVNADSTAWEPVHETEVAAGLRPGNGRELAVPWELLGPVWTGAEKRQGG